MSEADWIDQYTKEHGRTPTYDDYLASQKAAAISKDYPGLSPVQLYYAANPWLAPRDYWGGNQNTGGGGAPAPTPTGGTAVYTPVNNWTDWMTQYGFQPGDVNTMPDAMKAVQSGAGAQGLWDQYTKVAMPGATDKQRQVLANRYNAEYGKYVADSQLRALQGGTALGWHNYLTNKGPAGLEQDWASISPTDRGETPWLFNERQRIQYI